MSPHRWKARDIVRRVQAREISAHEVAEAICRQVERQNPVVNALADFEASAVLAEAQEVDRRLVEGEYLPLAGVPLSIKDNIWVRGRPATFGSWHFRDFLAPRDAWCVARLREKGAVILGLSNCSEFACKGVTSTPLHGITRNPWNLLRTPGGSSGGAVAAVAAGMGPLALATDAGGSIRRPAAHTGLVGMKPSLGVVPHPWGFQDPNLSLSSIGQIGRDVSDVYMLMESLRGFHPADAYSVPLCDEDEPTALPKKIAFSFDLGLGYPLDQDVRAAMEKVLARLDAEGWQLREAAPQWPPELPGVSLMPLQHAGLAALFGTAMHQQSDLFDPAIVAQIKAGEAVSGMALAAALMLRERIVASLADFFETYDLLLCPTVPVEPWPLEQLGPERIGGQQVGPRGHAVLTPLFNFGGVPAVSIPCGFGASGLPLGLQLVGTRFSDRRLLRAAYAIECLLGLEMISPLLDA
jgi:aspartyl-tRNA(Asn)/glutamyl-tRNA(Gln) amidotransferase subunit A